MDYRHLVQLAFEIRENSYAPYSGFKSGAALLCENGEVYTGCNIEVASFKLSVGAGESAIICAVNNGETKFKALALVGGSDEDIDYCPPDGCCRQMLEEFCADKNFEIILAKSVNEFLVYSFDDLYPFPFSKKNVIG